MLEIDICFRPLRLIPWERHIKAKLPIHWNELTQKQFLAIRDLQQGLLSDLKMIQIFLKVNRKVARSVNCAQLKSIKDYLKKFEVPEPMDKFVITKFLYFIAPEAQLKNINLIAFVLGEFYFQHYIKGDEDALNRFIACYYYDKKEFNFKLIEHYSIIIRVVGIRIRRGIADNYAFIRMWLVKTYPYAFWHIEEIQKQKKLKSLNEVLKYIYRDNSGPLHYNRSMHELLDSLNQTIKLQYGDINKIPLYKNMFLDPIQFFPGVENLNPDSDMLRNGMFSDLDEKN
jgi:hypothetical protein